MLKYTFRATDLTIHTKLERLQVTAVNGTKDGCYFTTENCILANKAQPAFHSSPRGRASFPWSYGLRWKHCPAKSLLNAPRYQRASELTAWRYWKEGTRRLLPCKVLPLEEIGLPALHNSHVWFAKTSRPTEIATECRAELAVTLTDGLVGRYARNKRCPHYTH